VTPRRPGQRAFSPGETLLDIHLDAARVAPRGGSFMLNELIHAIMRLLGFDDEDDDNRSDDRRNTRDRDGRRRDDREDDGGLFDLRD
jgi:hypothetical protein